MVYVLGLDAATMTEDEVPADVVALADQRVAARAAKDWAEADRLRTAVQERGFEVRDAAGGYELVCRGVEPATAPCARRHGHPPRTTRPAGLAP